MTANSLVAAQVDRGSMAYLLSTPTKRSIVVGTQATYLITAIIVMFAIVTTVGVVAIQIFQSDTDVSITSFLLLNLGLFLLMFATSSISFLFSCIFNLSKNSLAFGAGIPLAFFLFQLIGQVSESLEEIKYLSLNTLFDTKAILNGGRIYVRVYHPHRRWNCPLRDRYSYISTKRFTVINNLQRLQNNSNSYYLQLNQSFSKGKADYPDVFSSDNLLFIVNLSQCERPLKWCTFGSIPHL